MSAADLAQSIGRELPYLRRYARALTGTQRAGDNYAAATLEAILADRSMISGEDTRISLFRAFHAIWQSSGQPVETDDQTSREARAQSHLRTLTPNSREALLLRTIEELRYDQIGEVMQIDQDEAEELVQIALNEMGRAIRGRVKELVGAEAADAVRIQYGGSVKASNIVDIMAQPDVDGALVGGASLDADEFARIVLFYRS